MKDYIVTIIACVLAVVIGLTALEIIYEHTYSNLDILYERYKVISQTHDSNNGYCYLTYDINTNVMYICVQTMYSASITPFYTSQGKLGIYGVNYLIKEGKNEH